MFFFLGGGVDHNSCRGDAGAYEKAACMVAWMCIPGLIFIHLCSLISDPPPCTRARRVLGMNNQVSYISVAEQPARLVMEKEYLGSVAAVHLSATHAAVLTAGRIQVCPPAVIDGRCVTLAS